jgi:hypothetical protein
MEKAELTPTDWPVVTRSLLADIERIAATHEESQVNQGVLALVRARKALMDARLAVINAKRLYPEKPELNERLESIASDLFAQHARFPLTVLVNGSRPRPPIMGGDC